MGGMSGMGGCYELKALYEEIEYNFRDIDLENKTELYNIPSPSNINEKPQVKNTKPFNAPIQGRNY